MNGAGATAGATWRRRGLRLLGWAMALTLIVPVLVFVAWLASNWSDVPAQPQPAALALWPPQLADSRNGFWPLAGLLAPPGTDGAATARREWGRLQGLALLTHAERELAFARWQAEAAQQQPPARYRPGPSGPPWVCRGDGSDCTAVWLGQREDLARQLEAATWGPDCNALIAPGFTLEEPVPLPMRPATPVPPLTGATACMQWFTASAVLAFARDDRPALLAAMAGADRLNRALQTGTRSLIGHTIALRMAGRMADTAVQLALRDASLAEAFAPMLSAGPPARERIGRWVAYEVAYQRGVVDDLLAGCVQPSEVRLGQSRPIAWPERLNEGVNRWLCGRHIGLQPELMAQTSERRWLALLARVDADWPGIVAAPEEPPPSWTWRNTTASMLLAAAVPAWADVLQRHADFELRQRTAALVLAIQRQGIDPAARASWLARQSMLPHERERIQFEDGGRTIVARGWRTAAPQPSAARYTWPP